VPVRKNAAWALGALGNPLAIAALEEALTDSDESVRAEAGKALAKLKGTST